MKKFITLLVLIAASTTLLRSQTIMNIHQSNGTIIQLPLSTIDSITYTIVGPGNLATLTTFQVSDISGSTATSGGDILSTGGTSITQLGVVWSTNPNPTTSDNLTNEGSGSWAFTSYLTGLSPNTTYYVRAYAINSAGTAYGNEVSFITVGDGGIIVSNPGAGVTFDGYNYPSIVMGNGQEWMAENLRTTVYANGNSIPNVTDYTQWTNFTGGWVHYNNDSQYENSYGKLYNWYTVVDPRNVCPIGWHVPTDAEWTVFINYLDTSADGGNNESNTAGAKMKSIGTQHWESPNVGANNESDFSALPGGLRYSVGMFASIGSAGFWWSSTQSDSSYAWFRGLYSEWAYVARNQNNKLHCFSIRCLRD